MPRGRSIFKKESKDRFLQRKSRFEFGEQLHETPLLSTPKEHSIGKLYYIILEKNTI